jgi:phosphosulfolactate synthase (CoM biosynthesis protein A)
MSYLRDNGIITEKEYVGKTMDEAKKYAEEGGFEVRIVEQNGIALMLDMSTKSNRINFRVRDGYVTAAFGG